MSVYRRISAAAVPLFVGLMAIGAAATSGRADSAPPGDSMGQMPLRCEIQKAAVGGSISLAAVLHADTALSGFYSLQVTSRGGGNSSDINQGGPFAADGNTPLTLGTVMLGAGSAYTASLTVTANGTTLVCDS